MGDTVVENVKQGVTTSDPFFRFSDVNARRFAEEPEFTKIPYCFPNSLLIVLSNSFV